MQSDKQNRVIQLAELGITLTLLAAILVAPIFTNQNNDVVRWSLVYQAWLNFLPFLVVFLINHFLLLPYLLFRNRKLNYALCTFFLLSFITLYFYVTIAPSPTRGMRPRGPGPNQFNEQTDMRPDNQNFRPQAPPPRNPLSFLLPPYINAMLISLLILGFDTGLRSSFRWSKIESDKIKLEKENVKNRLSMLQNQVSPHFFMNTLNNVHALIDIDTEQAKEAVIKLSKMMRHLLHEPESGKTSLAKEVNFLKSYVDLMTLRFTDNVKVSLDISSELPDKDIPPLIFTSLIENAFKHGVSYKSPSFIDISLHSKNDVLIFEVKNSKHEQVNDPSTGIGIKNTRDRLDLIFGKQYSMNITEESKTFKVSLTFPL